MKLENDGLSLHEGFRPKNDDEDYDSSDATASRLKAILDLYPSRLEDVLAFFILEILHHELFNEKVVLFGLRRCFSDTFFEIERGMNKG